MRLKKAISIIAALGMIISLSACGNGNNNAADTVTQNKEEAAEDSTQTEAAAPKEGAALSAQEQAVQQRKENKNEICGGREVTISVLTKDAINDARGIANTKIFEMFMEEHPNVTIIDESVSGTAFDEKFTTAIASGNAPDFIQNYGVAQIWPLVQQGKVVDLDPYLEIDTEWSDNLTHLDTLKGLWTFEDKGVEGTYAAIRDIYSMGLFYNVQLFEEYNLEVPETLEEFEKVCDEFLKHDIIPMPLGANTVWRGGHMYTTLAMAMYGSSLQEDLTNREQKWNDEQMLSVFQKLKEWQEKGYFGPNIASMDYTMEKTYFLEGQAAMLCDASWFIQQIDQDKWPEGTIGFAPFPYPEDKPELKGSYMGGPNGAYSIVDNADPDKIEAAVALLEYHTSPEITEYKIEAYGGIFPVVTSLSVDDMLPIFTDYYAVLDSAADMCIGFEFYDTIPELETTVRNSLLGMFAGETPEEATAQIQSLIDNNSK